MRREHRIFKFRHLALRDDVEFTDANDHNPQVLDECPECHGLSRTSVLPEQCHACGGTGATAVSVRYFDNDAPVAEVARGRDGWITCPCCGWRFSTADRKVWSGLRHVRCGQRIRIIGGDA